MRGGATEEGLLQIETSKKVRKFSQPLIRIQPSKQSSTCYSATLLLSSVVPTSLGAHKNTDLSRILHLAIYE